MSVEGNNYDEVRSYWYVPGEWNFFPYLKEVLIKNLDKYVDKHNFLHTWGYGWGVDDDFNMQKYDPGKGYVGEHCEACANTSKRVVAWMFYLNDIRNKGGTRWPQQNFTARPRAGDLYIWPAAWTHSHYGIPAPKETKYIITGCASFDGDNRWE